MPEKDLLCWYHQQIGRHFEASHYGRHYCPQCHKLEIVPMCAHCKKNYEDMIKHHGNYDWQCENCGAQMERRVVGAV